MNSDSDKNILGVSDENKNSARASSDGAGSPGHLTGLASSTSTSSRLSLTGELPLHLGDTGRSNTDCSILNRAQEDVTSHSRLARTERSS